MIINNIDDTAAIARFEEDCNEMKLAIARLGSIKRTAASWRAALRKGKVTQQQYDEAYDGLRSSMVDAIFIIQERGLGLGESDEMGWDDSANIAASHYLNK